MIGGSFMSVLDMFSFPISRPYFVLVSMLVV